MYISGNVYPLFLCVRLSKHRIGSHQMRSNNMDISNLTVDFMLVLRRHF